MTQDTITWEDLSRLMTELQERDGDGIESTTWAEMHGIDPEALVQVVGGMVGLAQGLLDAGLNQHVEEMVESGDLTETEDGHMVVGVPFDVGQIIGMVAFNSFAIGWESALQYGPARVALPEEDP